jgi:hypothetical protein
LFHFLLSLPLFIIDVSFSLFCRQQLVSKGEVMAVLNMCGTSASFQITHEQSKFIGYGDLHNNGFDSMEVIHEFGVDPLVFGCPPTLSIYPTSTLEDQYSSRDPVLTTFLVGLMFGLSIFLFILYDKYVRRRQDKVEKDALQTEAIVSQLFPGRIRNLVIKEDSNENDMHANGGINKDVASTIAQADFFPEVTVMFADVSILIFLYLLLFLLIKDVLSQPFFKSDSLQQVVGFTAWSSLREPQQVFQLLEATFSAFDE